VRFSRLTTFRIGVAATLVGGASSVAAALVTVPGFAAATITGALTGLTVWQQAKAEQEKVVKKAKPPHKRSGEPL
jgi:acyl-CoA reductase-like NAD-dependent aldehyde dehydrogenase